MENISMTVQQFSHFVPVGTPVMFQSKARKTTGAPVQITPKDSFQLQSANHKRDVTFGSGEQDPNFKDLFKTTGKVLKAKYRKAKEYAKRELAKPGSEKKAALLAGGTALTVEFALLGGVTGGALTATALSAAGGYGGAKVAKSQMKKNQTPPPPPPRTDRHSDEGDHASESL